MKPHKYPVDPRGGRYALTVRDCRVQRCVMEGVSFSSLLYTGLEVQSPGPAPAPQKWVDVAVFSGVFSTRAGRGPGQKSGPSNSAVVCRAWQGGGGGRGETGSQTA